MILFNSKSQKINKIYYELYYIIFWLVKLNKVIAGFKNEPFGILVLYIFIIIIYYY